MSTELMDEFERIENLPALQRGQALPVLIQRLFEEAGYEARRGAAAARPRDADLYVYSPSEDFLIEVKSGNTSTGVDDVDQLAGRLGRTAPYVIGVLISRAPYTKGALKLVGDERRRPILLVDRSEILVLLAGGLTPRTLLRQKRQSLVVDARVEFFGSERRGRLPSRSERLPLPGPNVHVLEGGRLSPAPWLVTRGGVGDWIFVPDVPDVDWTVALGRGAGLDVDMPFHSVDDVAGGFEILRRHGWLTKAGRFSIHQMGVSWHGAGAAGFLMALTSQQERNTTEPDLRPHSEEHAIYFDEYRPGSGSIGGPYTLVLRVLVGSRPRILEAQFSLQLDGVPLDTSRLRLTMESFSVDEKAAFRSLDSPRREMTAFRHGEVPLRVQREITTEVEDKDPDTWISGVVADNPFVKESLASRLPGDVRHALTGLDTVVCSFGAWYTAERRPTTAYVTRVESMRTASALVLSIHGDWRSET